MPATVPSGVFWADDVQTLENDPEARLATARVYLPLPAAFREAATALRALILARSKQSADGSDLLSQLHLIAAQESFLLATSYVPGVGPSSNVAATIPRHVWQQLPMPYEVIGYQYLSLLDWTDCRWLVAAWGEPDAHCSARDYHQAVWDDYVAEYRNTC
jgi:hypothetical protein